ncbi:signal recognition particle receptor subunit beta [Klebsormidium nitens]|uniref:Signal recognition particle receptor subunit beta n=1 Tax=Klebsormidium nitens TaxID=105231 RepID=A0A1Y1HNX6_KLENI|nr:signal recognition particle receptor subunit beta [Klebsormidium nitens]|eukprot:GAQ79462.1 signal recognition particle receptor subunit beta [Klebsormidium nitens]
MALQWQEYGKLAEKYVQELLGQAYHFRKQAVAYSQENYHVGRALAQRRLQELAQAPPIADLAKQLDARAETLVVAALAALLLVVLVPLLLLLRSAKKSKGDTIILAGLTGAGKTALFTQLRDGSLHSGTVTSMEPNVGRFVLYGEKPTSKPVQIADIPGHPRLRTKLDEYLPKARGIVFVVDAVDFMPNLRAVTELLYDILTRREVVRRRIPVLIACNKMDRLTAHTVDFIRKQLEKEIDKLRVTRTSISDADVGSAEEIHLGKEGEAFKFAQTLNKVTVEEVSVHKDNLDGIREFIRERIKA